jgi:guanine deaminase
MSEAFMRAAVRAGTLGMRAGHGGPFGAVVVRDGAIVGRGSNQVTSTHDPTAHAEIVAIRDACQTLGTFRLEGCDIYASCEPCPMCLGAIYWARLDRLFYAATRDDAAAIGFDDARLYREMTLPPAQRSLTSVQLLRDEALVALAEWRQKPDKTLY